MGNKAIGGGLLLIGLVLIIAGAGMAFDRAVIKEAQYSKSIGDWAKNAEDAPTFQQSITFLQKFNDSMNHEGLTPDMYNAAFSWGQTPQNSMTFQYSYVGQMIVRANYYINLTVTAKAQSPTGQFTDIYNQALTNFRNEMNHNGPLDWVAHDAYMLKNGWYWQGYSAAALIVPGFLIAGLGFFIASTEDSETRIKKIRTED